MKDRTLLSYHNNLFLLHFIEWFKICNRYDIKQFFFILMLMYVSFYSLKILKIKPLIDMIYKCIWNLYIEWLKKTVKIISWQSYCFIRIWTNKRQCECTVTINKYQYLYKTSSYINFLWSDVLVVKMMQFSGTHTALFSGMVYCFSVHLKYKMTLY